MKRYIKSAVKDLSSEDTRTRSLIALQPNSPRMFEELANDPDELVRFQVARNKSTPVEILEKLAKDPYKLVRDAVYLNPNTPKEVAREIDQTQNDFSGKADIKLEVESQDGNADKYLHKLLTDLGYTIYSEDYYDYTGNGDFMYSCICGDFGSPLAIYHVVDVLEDKINSDINHYDMSIRLYNGTLLLR